MVLWDFSALQFTAEADFGGGHVSVTFPSLEQNTQHTLLRGLFWLHSFQRIQFVVGCVQSRNDIIEGPGEANCLPCIEQKAER